MLICLRRSVLLNDTGMTFQVSFYNKICNKIFLCFCCFKDLEKNKRIFEIRGLKNKKAKNALKLI